MRPQDYHIQELAVLGPLDCHSDIAATRSGAVPRLVTDGCFDKHRNVLAPELQLAERAAPSLHAAHDCGDGSVLLMWSKDVEAFVIVRLIGESDSTAGPQVGGPQVGSRQPDDQTLNKNRRSPSSAGEALEV
jgi:hypothetical protein